ncbi:MAG: hypothetical protein ACKO2K_18360 [Alphaproteobacteria bacterium]
MAVASACSSPDPKQALAERVDRFDDLRQKADWASIYRDMLDPEIRKSLKIDDFLKPREQSTMEFLGARVGSFDPKGDRVTVPVEVDANVPVMRPGGPPLTIRKQIEEKQDWVRRDGQWYVRLEK